jgi:hypothetical protein
MDEENKRRAETVEKKTKNDENQHRQDGWCRTSALILGLAALVSFSPSSDPLSGPTDGDDPVEPGSVLSGAPATSNCRYYRTSSKVFCHLGIISTIGVECVPALIGRLLPQLSTIAGTPDVAACPKVHTLSPIEPPG